MMGILLTVVTGMIWYFVGVIFAGAPKDSRKLFSFFFLNTAVFFLVMLVYTFGIRQLYPDNWKELLILAVLIFPIGLNSMFTFYLLKRALECGPQSIAWSIMQFGFAESYLLSVLFLGEKLTFMSVTGMCLISTSILLFTYSMYKKTGSLDGFQPRRYCILLLIAFVCTGLGHFLYMLPNQPVFGLSAKTLEFRAVLLPVPQLLWIIPCLRMHATISDMKEVGRRAAVYGLVVMAGQIFFFYAIDALSRSQHIGLAAPLATGICILLFFLYRVISRKERADLPMYLGLAAGIAGIFMMAKIN